MVTAFLDSAIIVDLLRGYSPAVAWIKPQKNLGITPFVWMEIVVGADNKIIQQQSIKFLSQFEMVYPIHADIEWTMQQIRAYSLSHSVAMADALIAAIPYRLNLPLYTRNLKHFRPMLGSLAQAPY